jgi:hypothetical protein
VKPYRLLAIAGTIFLVASGVARADWRTYDNRDIGYSIAYPAELFGPPVADPAQGGLTLTSDDGEARLFIFGGPNRDRETVASLAEGLADLDDVHRVTYRRISGNWFVLSGYLAGSGDIFYERVALSRDRRVLAGFRLEYPSSDRKTFDHLIGRLGRSLVLRR